MLECLLAHDVVYNRVSPTFHHWQIHQKRFGLTFLSPSDAQTFDGALRKALEDLEQGKMSQASLWMLCWPEYFLNREEALLLIIQAFLAEKKEWSDQECGNFLRFHQNQHGTLIWVPKYIICPLWHGGLMAAFFAGARLLARGQSEKEPAEELLNVSTLFFFFFFFLFFAPVQQCGIVIGVG